MDPVIKVVITGEICKPIAILLILPPNINPILKEDLKIEEGSNV